MVKASMFTRARLGLDLTPGERAFLRFVQGIVPTVLASGIVAAVPFLESQSVNWKEVATVAVVAMSVNLFNTLQKYFTAQGDGALAGVAGSVATAVGSAAPQSSPQPVSNI